jgi:hypothetical protein
MSVDDIIAAHDDYYTGLRNGIKRLGGDRLQYVIDQLLATAGQFERYEYGIIQSLNAPKKTHSKIGEEIAKALTSVALATFPEYELAKEVAKTFLDAAITHLNGVDSDGVDVQAVRGELTRSVDALAQAFTDAINMMTTEKHGLPASVDQYIREFVATYPNTHESLGRDEATFGWFCDQLHVVDGQAMDPSSHLYWVADQQMQMAYQSFIHQVQWEALNGMERIEYLEKLESGERRPYLQSLGLNPDEWLMPGDDVKLMPFG